jgi:hypothetical protein
MAEAGSIRKMRRKENAHPATAAISNNTVLEIKRVGVTSSGMDPGGMAKLAATRSAAEITHAMVVTTRA